MSILLNALTIFSNIPVKNFYLQLSFSWTLHFPYNVPPNSNYALMMTTSFLVSSSSSCSYIFLPLWFHSKGASSVNLQPWNHPSYDVPTWYFLKLSHLGVCMQISHHGRENQNRNNYIGEKWEAEGVLCYIHWFISLLIKIRIYNVIVLVRQEG